MQLSRKRNQYHPCHSVENVTVSASERLEEKTSLAAAVSLDGSLTDLQPKIAVEYMDRPLYFKFSNVQMTTRVRVDFFRRLFHDFDILSLCDHNAVLVSEAQCRLLASRG